MSQEDLQLARTELHDQIYYAYKKDYKPVARAELAKKFPLLLQLSKLWQKPIFKNENKDSTARLIILFTALTCVAGGSLPVAIAGMTASAAIVFLMGCSVVEDFLVNARIKKEIKKGIEDRSLIISYLRDKLPQQTAEIIAKAESFKNTKIERVKAVLGDDYATLAESFAAHGSKPAQKMLPAPQRLLENGRKQEFKTP